LQVRNFRTIGSNKRPYEGKTNIICEVERTAFKLGKGIGTFKAMGMRIRYMDPKAHDNILHMSHLSHISAFMLGKTVINKEKHEQDIFDMAGLGFESTVRLAKVHQPCGPYFKQNKGIIETLEEFISNLTQFKDLLIKEDYNAILKKWKA
jgi:prephenate dehydrogenase